ncbi:response regulator transcription factor [Streptomyces sp. H39-S7]|uniref:response regulator transcription factor n=1 Tax=Streptomyces sp. H39-S7 TaxID=3004357 RepID=UPI0022AF3BE4|nr:response regulator transcription factor [Streptomyces sp. H39-S7]MCZ4123621.1 response regulator transcription factor [Streptomyces sp. H39-S7]
MSLLLLCARSPSAQNVFGSISLPEEVRRADRPETAVAAFRPSTTGRRGGCTAGVPTLFDLAVVPATALHERPADGRTGEGRTPHMAQIQLLIADDQVVTRSGLMAMTREAPGLDVAGVAQDMAGVLTAVDHGGPDIVLLNLRTLTAERFRHLVRLIGAHASIIVLWCHDSLVTIQDALRAKVAGFMDLEILQEDFASVISLVNRGCAVYLLPHERLSDISTEYPASAAPVAISSLTSRENDVLLLLADGMTNKQIGSTLHIAENTVKKHVHRAMIKLSASNRVEAALLVSQLGPKR